MQEGLPTFLSTGKETLQSEARHKGASTITVISHRFIDFEWYNTEQGGGEELFSSNALDTTLISEGLIRRQFWASAVVFYRIRDF